MEKESLIRLIIDCAYSVRRVFPAGLVESIYQNSLFVELKKRGLTVEREVPFQVTYEGVAVGQFRADIVVNGLVILELKAVNELLTAHEIQLVNYLNISGIDDGLLINFGALEHLEIRRKFRLYRPKGSGPRP